MTITSLQKRIEDIRQRPPEEVGEALWHAFEEINADGMIKAVAAYPGVLAAITDVLLDTRMDRALPDRPEIFNGFMDVFWTGVKEHARKSSWMQSTLLNTKDLKVNMEASDSPLRGHFEIAGGGIWGGTGMLHFKEQDVRFLGTTRTLLTLLRGDLPMGLGNLALQTEGHPALLPILAPVMKALSALIR